MYIIDPWSVCKSLPFHLSYYRNQDSPSLATVGHQRPAQVVLVAAVSVEDIAGELVSAAACAVGRVAVVPAQRPTRGRQGAVAHLTDRGAAAVCLPL